MSDNEKKPEPALNIRDLTYHYGTKCALNGVTFNVQPSSFTALLGPNGAGKTTLFALITRLFDAPSGDIAISGRSLRNDGAKTLKPLGVVFQQPTLDLDLSVEQNLTYHASLHGLAPGAAKTRIQEELTRLNMADRRGDKVRTLNGGHRRRVEIARALLHDPKILLLDEPTVGLDVESRKSITHYIHELARQRKIAVLWATHLIDEIEDGDDLIILHQGQVKITGSSHDVLEASNTKTLDAAFAHYTGRKEDAA